MKMLLTLSAGCLLACSCVFNPAENAIKRYMKTVLNDPDSYEVIATSPVHATFDFPNPGFFHEYLMQLFPFTGRVRDVSDVALASKIPEIHGFGVTLDSLNQGLQKIMTMNLLKYDSIQYEVVKVSNKVYELKEAFYNKYFKAYIDDGFILPLATLKETAKSFSEVEDKYRTWAMNLCVPLKELNQAMNDDRVYAHKFRARNGFGGMMPAEYLMILSADKRTVDCAVEMKLD